ncbi:hypothetical protein BC940DRAFT_319031 [Gongronella butleri]|nr:hypothetical protein BC940DRAFT_319031 [Gongronella butleri]
MAYGFPSIQKDKVRDVINIFPDGKCGFRALAYMLKVKDQDQFKVVKQDMLEHLMAREARSQKHGIFLDDNIEKLKNSLLMRDESVTREYWFTTVDCVQLVADTYNVAVEVHTDTVIGNKKFEKGVLTVCPSTM